MNKLEINGDWKILSGIIKQKWAKLTDSDLRFVAGKEEELIGRIQRRTGEARENVERALRETFGDQSVQNCGAENSVVNPGPLY